MTKYEYSAADIEAIMSKARQDRSIAMGKFIADLLSDVKKIILRLSEPVIQSHKRSLLRAKFRDMSDRQLRDIGLTSYDRYRVVDAAYRESTIYDEMYAQIVRFLRWSWIVIIDEDYEYRDPRMLIKS